MHKSKSRDISNEEKRASHMDEMVDLFVLHIW